MNPGRSRPLRWKLALRLPHLRHIGLFAVAVGMLIVLLTGCSPFERVAQEGSARGSDWPPAVPHIRLTLKDDAIEVDGPVPSGRVVFRVHNAGSQRHRVTLIPLPDDLPPLDEQLAGDERRSVTPLAGTNTHPPGEGTAFAVDLDPEQRYGLVCFEETADGLLHARTGENTEFRTAKPQPPSSHEVEDDPYQ